ncbi:MAG: bifunctional UDP-N-acetylglucosamine diphosphorylase/glucosamine-1-phosphate N-acetyltransferase GlmU [Deltaproteobacteria bacterium]|nr:bifunctional UDP-N-acetylglucosamine diphosphorylase/glucosamine-1-phosphate N-acetyltransferase GlmU [Deltaproteobacteria bacterium]
MKPLGIILLAAGLGKRMMSDLPKVLHHLGGRPLILYPLRIAQSLEPQRVVIVVGNGAEGVRQLCGDDGITWVTQQEQLGTGHAVLCARDVFFDFRGDLLILSGDVPLITRTSLAELLRHHSEQNRIVTLMTASVERPAGYGRVLRDSSGGVVGIVEDRDATGPQSVIKEVNVGIYAVSPRFLFSALDGLSNRNQQGEYYLPDIVGIASRKGEGVGTVQVEDTREILGINTREELALMERNLQERVNQRWMESGVTLKDPRTTYIEEGVLIGKDTIIGPNTHLLGRTVVGERCLIDGSAYVMDTRLGNGVRLKFSVVLTECELDEMVEIGPFAHLRPGTVLKRNVHVGCFVEVKNSLIGEETKANHLAYIGDATLGKGSNIGAGTITCNYDGFEKHRTTIGDRVQVGSSTQLVAPVVVGDDAYIGAGSTITQDVPSGALALSRVAQKNVVGWVQRFRERHNKKQ